MMNWIDEVGEFHNDSIKWKIARFRNLNTKEEDKQELEGVRIRFSIRVIIESNAV